MPKPRLVELNRSEIGEIPLFSNRYGKKELNNLLQRDFAKLFALRCEGRLLGYAVVWLIGKEAQLHWFEIFEPFRYKGLGSIFMGKLLSQLRKEKVERIILEVSEKNTPALRLYEKVGFKRVGMRKNYYPDGSNALLMEVTL
ncbi:MAG TPA: GNAT family N-acetyltransferase [Aquifex aeolicus]|uniref:GNAT family N-acetyltransferase n=1 Tax=Aquifex aeolicus TaxID=63363 RepID=A0A9D0YNA4_AQUAO|nr:GNAT family N-acetyltransferase [Aquificales bacterium]HIP86654.1 GNAT family N-acetyltransferase [Aquifex sp.]HIP97848.1 GNAT family N-acetyltransferase [Aquifex aeolicus]HIQ26319.1 GNAT family N-acetyltransferase [Aquifex aeolicus]